MACTALGEFEERVEVYVTMNKGLDNVDQDFFRRFESAFWLLNNTKGNVLCSDLDFLEARRIEGTLSLFSQQSMMLNYIISTNPFSRS